MSKVLEQSSKERRVSVQTEAREMLWQVAGPPSLHDNRKSWLNKAARALGWGQRRTRAIFYCEARTITADEWRILNWRLAALKKAERRHEEQVDELREVLRVAREGLPVAGRDTGRLDGEVASASDPRRGPRDEA